MRSFEKLSFAVLISAIRLSGRILKYFRFRGYWRACNFLGSFSSLNAVIQVNNFSLKFPVSDPYWAQLISPYFKYEPELEYFLLREPISDMFFVDCGANIGYWSLFASKVLGIKEIYSIEPNRQNFHLLSQNLDLNLVRAFVYEKAIGREGQKFATLSVPKTRGYSVASSISDLPAGNDGYRVEIISLFEILSKALLKQNSGIIKLDIEGAELLALDSIKPLMNFDLQIIFEDHGSNINSPIVNWFLLNSDYRVFYLPPNGQLVQVESFQEANSLKTDKRAGYNFVAMPNRLS
jgi:FkbM family methyltransferase